MTTVPTTRRPMRLAIGDLLTTHPDHPEQMGEWTVSAKPRYVDPDNTKVAFDYTTADGEGVFVVDADSDIAVDVALANRRRFIADLREMATWLEERPEIPLNPYQHIDINYFPRHEDAADAIAEVDRIAGLLGVEVTTNVHHEAQVWLGSVGYSAVVCGVHPEEKAEASA